MIINEDFLDNEKIDDIMPSEREISTSRLEHSFIVGVVSLFDKKNKQTVISAEHLRLICKSYNLLCGTILFIENYSVSVGSNGSADDNYIYLDDLSGNYKKFAIKIDYNISSSNSIEHFMDACNRLLSHMFNILANRFMYRVESNVFFAVDGMDVVLVEFMTLSYMKKYYSVIMNQEETSLEITPVKSDYKFTGKAYLSRKSALDLDEINPGQILYSTNAGDLVLDDETDGAVNTPIAIYVTGSNPHTFIALRYLSPYSPSIGSIEPVEMYFGNHKNDFQTPIKNNSKSREYELMELPYSAVNYVDNNGIFMRIKSKHIENSPDKGSYVPIRCCYEFHTLGTKKGQWHLPDLRLLSELAGEYNDLRDDINETRKSLGLDGLAECYLHTWEEINTMYAITVDMTHGSYDDNNMKLKNDISDKFAIAFINVYK